MDSSHFIINRRDASYFPSPHTCGGFDCGIFHPYLGTILIDTAHPLLVTRDTGRSLSQAAHDPAFLHLWRTSHALRNRFLVEVGMSALNLVRACQCCHNDTRYYLTLLCTIRHQDNRPIHTIALLNAQ